MMAHPTVRERMISTAHGLRFHASVTGEGDPIVFLHGFPELGRFWRPLMTRLSARWTCWAPDQRGYGRSDRAATPDDYGVDALLTDVTGILDALDLGRVHLVGHDWGGVLAWWFAGRAPERVRTLTVFNAPHPVALQRRLIDDPDQRARSAYIGMLKGPGAEAFFNSQTPEQLWARYRSAELAFDAEDREEYLAAWTKPDAWAGPVGWYRASPFVLEGQAPWADEDFAITAPTLIVWGLADRVFVPELAHDSASRCRDARVVRLADVGHSPPRQAPDACAAAMIEFLTGADAS